jgi:hypothetical protein
MAVIGAIMPFRPYFRGKDDAFLGTTGQADRRAFKRWSPLTSKIEAKAEDGKALRWGIVLIVIGTIIWAYGDLLPLKAPPKQTSRTVAPAI